MLELDLLAWVRLWLTYVVLAPTQKPFRCIALTRGRSGIITDTKLGQIAKLQIVLTKLLTGLILQKI